MNKKFKKNIIRVGSSVLLCLLLSGSFISCDKKGNNNEEQVNKKNEQIVSSHMEESNKSNKENIKQSDKEKDAKKETDQERYERERNKNYERLLEEHRYSNDDIEIELFIGENKGHLDTYLRAFDKQGNLKWEKMWDCGEIATLSPASGFKVTEDRIYVPVLGDMYAYVRDTGEELWKVEVGSCSNSTPEIDDEGNIYTTGYYGPFTISISNDGKIRWKKDYENMWWPYDLKLSKDKIIVEFEGGTYADEGKCIFDKEGNEIMTDAYLNSSMITATSSSFLKSHGNNTYNANNIIEGMDTAWVEAIKGNGEGEWVKIDYKEEFKPYEIVIENGYKKSKQAYYNNNRVKRIKIETEDGKQTWEKTLHDNFEESNIITVNNASNCSSLKFTILDVYEGDKYDDTCITNIKVKGFVERK